MAMLKKNFLKKIVGVLFFGLSALPARAQLVNPLGNQTIGDFIIAIVNQLLVPIGTPIATLCIIIGAYYIVTSQGDSEKLRKGQWFIIYAMIGLAIILSATAIKNAIQGAVSGAGLV